MKDFKIETLKDVKEFIHWCFFDQNLNFNPDDQFASYINRETGEPTYLQESEYLDHILTTCWMICNEQEPNQPDLIYDIASREQMMYLYTVQYPESKQELINRLEEVTEDMETSEYMHFSAYAITIEAGKKEVKVYHGGLDIDGVFDQEFLDMFIINFVPNPYHVIALSNSAYLSNGENPTTEINKAKPFWTWESALNYIQRHGTGREHIIYHEKAIKILPVSVLNDPEKDNKLEPIVCE